MKSTLFSSEEVRRRAEDEAAFHLEMREGELIRKGHAPGKARHLARKAYGSIVRQQEQASDQDILAGLEGTLRDVKVAYRRLSRSPLFLVSSVLLLAIGLGVNTAVFSVLDTLFLRSLPYPNPDRLVVIEEFREGKISNSNPVRLNDWRSGVNAFEDVASTYGEAMQLHERDGNRSVQVIRVVGDWIGMLGVPVVQGRRFDADELKGAKLAMLTSKSRDLAHLGDNIRLGAATYQVIGIVDDSIAPGEDAQVVIPIDRELLEGSRRAGYLQGVARLKPTATIAATEAEANSVASRLEGQYPDTDRNMAVRIIPARDAWTADARKPALYIQAASGLLLLITLVNLAGLLAARALERYREDTVRLFLGAGRWHLIRLHLAEAGLLVTLGCLAAAVVAPWTLKLLKANYGSEFAPIMTAVIDARIFTFMIATGIASALLFAAIMAWQTSNERNPRGHSQFQLRHILIVTEAALGLVLLAAAFQLVRDFADLRFAPLGFREQGLLSARAYLSWSTDQKDLRAAVDRGKEQISALPGVSSVAVVDRLPLEGGSQDSPMLIQGQTEKTRDTVGLRMVSSNYFALMGIPLLSGQLPTDDNSVLVNETFARRYLDNSAINRNISTDGNRWHRIAGVVGDVRYSSKQSQPRPEVFLGDQTQFWPLLTFVIQTSQPASALAQPLRGIYSGINPDIDFRGVSSLENRLDEIVAQPRRQRDVAALFGAVALMLVIAGVYGMMASEMLRRRRELGIRIAIGATRANIISIALARAASLSIAASLAGGSILLLLLDRWVQPTAILAAVATVSAGMLTAGFIPAWRSSRIDPILALRQN